MPSRLSQVVFVGLSLTAFVLAGCAGPASRASDAAISDGCGPSTDCEEAVGLSEQVRLDTEAMLAGMAHARARLGLQEDAAP